MQRNEAYHWPQQGKHSQRVLISLKQPMTAKQLSKKTGLSLDACSASLSNLCINGIVICLSPAQRRSRVYWVTELGKSYMHDLLEDLNHSDFIYEYPEVDWNIYSWVCYSHRSSIIKALIRPMQPAEIKRKAKFNDPDLKMSANNVRDVIRLFIQKGIVRQLRLKGKTHPCYELTDLGLKLRRLLLSSESLS